MTATSITAVVATGVLVLSNICNGPLCSSQGESPRHCTWETSKCASGNPCCAQSSAPDGSRPFVATDPRLRPYPPAVLLHPDLSIWHASEPLPCVDASQTHYSKHTRACQSTRTATSCSAGLLQRRLRCARKCLRSGAMSAELACCPPLVSCKAGATMSPWPEPTTC